jgi:hypothetical protein
MVNGLSSSLWEKIPKLGFLFAYVQKLDFRFMFFFNVMRKSGFIWLMAYFQVQETTSV